MTRYPNPFAALSGLITKAFATLGDRDNPGGQNAFVVFPSRARGGHMSASQTPRATPRTTERGGRAAGRSESMQRRRHNDPR